MKAAPRVAFTLIGGRNWTGGYNYLLNLLSVLKEEAPGQIVPVLLAGADVPDTELAPFTAIGGCEVVRHPALNENRRSRALLASIMLGRDAQISAVLASQRVDLVFEAATFLGWRLGLPAIAWISDLQHRYLPHLFSRTGWLKREIGFRAQIMSGRTVMVSSLDARVACERFYPMTTSRIHAVRFAVGAKAPMDDVAARAVADRYGLPERYFFMPNQFWAHKNHMLVVQALALLRQRGQRTTVMATGMKADPRNAKYVPSLLRAVSDGGVETDLLMPGVIPYADLLPLMQASTALLNPSLFEGWSTTVEEARAAGVPMVLSDLDVHREQAGDHATYFDRHSVESLADTLANFKPPPFAERLLLREQARVDSDRRVKEFARNFLFLVHTAIESV